MLLRMQQPQAPSEEAVHDIGQTSPALSAQVPARACW